MEEGDVLDYTIKIGGEAGQGIQTIGDALSKIFSRFGYYVFTHQDYESRVRGGHNFYQIRFSDRFVCASRSRIDILIAFDETSIQLHAGETGENGIVVFDPADIKVAYNGPRYLPVPFAEIAKNNGGSKVMANTAAIGAVLGMLGYPIDLFYRVMEEIIKKRDEATLEANRRTAQAGHEYAGMHCSQCAFTLIPPSTPKMVIDGNEAIGFGAAVSGCAFYAAYPMTPSTGIMVSLAKKSRDYGILVEQAEDEIAAINMALGASFAGVRSMTGSSGGGFALMVEGLALAAMTETPIVIALAQRPGPATGLPTRTEQGELFFALHAGHGEFPRVIFAPGSPEQAFYLTNKAFDISQRYQIPVFILTDQYLADTQWAYDGFDMDRFIFTDYRLRGDALQNLNSYKRYAYSLNGVSPYAVPGQSKHLVITDSDEHDEEGHLVEDAPTRVKMVKKRYFEKIASITADIRQPLYDGIDNAHTIIVGWGSTYGIMKESVDMLAQEHSIAMFHFSEIYPFPLSGPSGYLEKLNRAKQTICIEQNSTSQFARLMKMETGFVFTEHITRYDGRPFLGDELTEVIRGYLR